MSHLPLISEWKHTIHQGMAANNHTQSRNDRLKVSCHYGNGSCIKIILKERSRFHQEKEKKKEKAAENFSTRRSELHNNRLFWLLSGEIHFKKRDSSEIYAP